MPDSTEELVNQYIESLPNQKRADMLELHQAIKKLQPSAKLWFLDGRNEEGKVVSNPNIGYGSRRVEKARGKSQEFYRVGLSAHTAGISVYVLGLEDKGFLANTFGAKLGKASVTGYCIKFKRLSDIDLNVLLDAVRAGFEQRRHAP